MIQPRSREFGNLRDYLFSLGDDLGLMTSKSADIAFLRSFLVQQQEDYRLLEKLSDDDVLQTDGLLPTSADDERCARLADENGFDGNLFRNLFVDENWYFLIKKIGRRIETIPRLIARIEQSSSAPVNPKFTLDANDLRILWFLAEQNIPRTQSEIEAGANVSRRTISGRLARLREQGLVFRPNGERGGEAITVVGRQEIEGSDRPEH